MRVDVAGVFVDAITKQETLNIISEYVASGQPHLIVTTYSEFVVFASKDSEYQNVLNSATLSLPDGIGILWAAKYLSLSTSNRFQALGQIIYSGASLIFNPSYCRTVIPETVTGSRLVWDIAQQASEKNYSLALVGGTNGVAQTAANELKKKYPNLKVKLAVSDNKFDQETVNRIASSNSDILLIAYQPPLQEKWLTQNLNQFNVKVAIGLGGTFDYLAGKRLSAPKFISTIGLEWLWRLITQPWRIVRIWNAIIVFIKIVYRYKIIKT